MLQGLLTTTGEIGAGSTVEDETESENRGAECQVFELQEMLQRHSLELSEREDHRQSCHDRLPSSSSSLSLFCRQ